MTKIASKFFRTFILLPFGRLRFDVSTVARRPAGHHAIATSRAFCGANCKKWRQGDGFLTMLFLLPPLIRDRTITPREGQMPRFLSTVMQVLAERRRARRRQQNLNAGAVRKPARGGSAAAPARAGRGVPSTARTPMAMTQSRWIGVA